MKARLLLLSAILVISGDFLQAKVIRIPADKATIQGGIAAADHGDTVLVSPGTYVENINFWGMNITVASLYLTTRDTSYISQTIIDGDGVSYVVEISNEEDSTALLSGFTIRNGFSDVYGGGINCFNASPRLENLYVTGNTAMYGGGIACRSRTIVDPQSHPSLTNVIVSNNTAQFGGGIHLEAGINSSAGILRTRLQNILVCGNTSTRGGGIMIVGKTETIIQNLTITNNSAVQSGGGISWMDYPLTIRNTIVWDNVPEEVYGTGTPAIMYSDIKGGVTGIGNINEDPKFAGIGQYPNALTGGSPCIDAGTPDTTGLLLPAKDLAGNKRLWNGDGNSVTVVDMGAYEYGSIPDAVHSQPAVNSPLLSVHCYPNPAKEEAIFQFKLLKGASVTLSIVDHFGQQIAFLSQHYQSGGKYRLEWDATGLAAGMYFYRLTANSGRQTACGKLILLPKFP